jgi:excisionase family DNA binding protein
MAGMREQLAAQNDTPARLVSTSAAARTLGISERYLRGLAARGHLRIVRLGRRVLVPRDELDRLVQEGAQ